MKRTVLLTAILVAVPMATGIEIFTVDSSSEWNSGTFVDTTETSGNLTMLATSLYEVMSPIEYDDMLRDADYDGSFLYTSEQYDTFRKHDESDPRVNSGNEWSTTVDPGGDPRVSYYNGNAYATTNELWRIDKSSGSATQLNAETDYKAIEVTSDGIFVASKYGRLYRIDFSGTIQENISNAETSGRGEMESLPGGDIIYAGEELRRYNPDLSFDWGKDTGEALKGLGISDNYIYVGEFADGDIYRIYPNNGSIVWSARPGGSNRVSDVEPGPGKTVWVAGAQNDDSIHKLDSKGNEIYTQGLPESPLEMIWNGKYLYSAGNDPDGGILEIFDDTYAPSGSYLSMTEDAGKLIRWDSVEARSALNGQSGQIRVQYSNNSFSTYNEESFSLQNDVYSYPLGGYSEQVRFNITMTSNSTETAQVDFVNISGYADTSPPEVNITAPTDTVQPGSFDVSVDDSEPDGTISSCSYRIRNDSDSWSAWNSRTCGGNFTVDIGPSDDCTRGFECNVSVRATNVAGLTGYDYQLYQAGIRTDTQIIAPAEGTWQQPPFDVNASDQSQNIDSCSYRVRNGSTWYSWQSRSCGTSSNFTVGSLECTVTGRDECEVQTRVEDISGSVDTDSRNFSIGLNPCPDSLACYLMDEGSGQTVFDYTSNGYDGYRGNSKTTDSYEPDWFSTCPLGNCLDFQDDDVVKVPQLPNVSTNLTMEVRINSSSIPSIDSTGTVLTKQESYSVGVERNTYYLMANIHNSSRCGAWCGDDDPVDPDRVSGWFISDFNISDVPGTNKVSINWNGTHMKFYVNSLKVDEVTSSAISGPTEVQNSTGPSYIGAGRSDMISPGGSFVFQGVMDDLRIYDKKVVNAKQNCREELEGIYYNGMKDPNSERLIQDAEKCVEISAGYVWRDQDYSEDVCRDGTWVTESEVRANEDLHTEGIDDDYNRGDSNYESRPGDSTWTSTESPVPTGNVPDQRDISTLGYCLGDDASEYRATQVCVSNLCSTDRSVIAPSDSEGSCALDGSTAPVSFSEVRRFDSGEQAPLTVSGEMACFDGAWYSNWPASFDSPEVDIKSGRTSTVNMKLINFRDRPVEYTVTLEDTDMAEYAEFPGRENGFEVEVGANSYRNIPVRILGGPESLGSGEVRVRADSTLGSITGEDQVTVNIQSGGTGETEARQVPGITFLQILAAAFVGSLIAAFS